MDAVIRRINRQSLRRWRPSGPVAARHGTNQRHRGTPGSGSHPPAPPGGADRGRPRSPGDDGGSGSGRRLVRRSGGWRRPPSRPDHPSPPPWPESRPATDHGAPCVHHVGGGGSRPVDAVCRSSRQTSAALLAARRDDGPAGAGLHPLPETVLPGSTPGVGLVRTLHERSPAGINGRRQEGERPNAVENDGIGSAADQTEPMNQDGSQTGLVSTSQATSRSGDTPTMTVTMTPKKRVAVKLSTGFTRVRKDKSFSFGDAGPGLSRRVQALGKSRNGN